MIKISGTIRINGEGTGWTVEQYKGKKIRKDKDKNDVEFDSWEVVTSHSRVESALDSVLNLQMKDFPDMNITEFLQEAKK